MGEGRAHELVLRTPDETAQRAIHIHDPRIEIDQGDAERSLIEDLTELLFALAELLLGALALCHVAKAPDPADSLAIHTLGLE